MKATTNPAPEDQSTEQRKKDGDLMRRLAANDPNAAEEIYDRFAGLVYTIAIRHLNNAAKAEDVTQEVFVKVWRNSASYDFKKSLLVTWISTIAKRTAIDAVRRTKSGIKADALDGYSEPAAASTDDTNKIEVAKRIKSAMEKLKPDDRELIYMHYFSNLTTEQIASIIKIPVGTVKSSMYRLVLPWHNI